MPRFYKKKKGRPKKRQRIVRNVRRNESWRIARPLKPRIDQFKRSFADNIDLRVDSPNVPVGWQVDNGGIYTTWKFKLDQLHDYSDFQNLYAMYRIKGIRMQMYFSNTASVIDSGTANPPNRQLLVYMTPNREGFEYDGTTTERILTEELCLDTQSCKKRIALNGGRPLDLYMSVRQRTVKYAQTVGTTPQYTTTASSPQWLATDQVSVDHYGLNMRIQRVDNEPLTTGGSTPQKLKMIVTIYFQCKQVQ